MEGTHRVHHIGLRRFKFLNYINSKTEDSFFVGIDWAEFFLIGWKAGRVPCFALLLCSVCTIVCDSGRSGGHGHSGLNGKGWPGAPCNRLARVGEVWEVWLPHFDHMPPTSLPQASHKKRGLLKRGRSAGFCKTNTTHKRKLPLLLKHPQTMTREEVPPSKITLGDFAVEIPIDGSFPLKI